jgi:ribosomal protein S18 acetylase RimI-like enzyme
MGAAATHFATPRSLVWATEIDVLAADHSVLRRDGYLMVRSPTNPEHYWGNLLLFDEPPGCGDRDRWELLFAQEFGQDPRVEHRTFCWDVCDGRLGRAMAEFAEHGYDLQQMVGLVAPAARLRPHARGNAEVEVRPLEVAERGPDAALWEQIVELWVASREAEHLGEQEYRRFGHHRLCELRSLFRQGRGGWYVALLGDTVVGSCGLVVTDGRARFQAVDTEAAHRRRGICSRLLAEAAAHAAAHHGAERFVICADPDYHALGIYESLGFRPAERVAGVCLRPAR